MVAERKRIKRRKTVAERKEAMIKIMVTSEQKQRFTAAAAAAELDLSSWLRGLAVRATKETAAGEG